jgi:hypothetical protein
MGQVSRAEQRADKAFEASAARVYHALMRLRRLVDALDGQGIYLKSVSIRFPNEARNEFFAVLKAATDEGNVVLFDSGFEIHDPLCSLVERLENGSAKWKEDQYG